LLEGRKAITSIFGFSLLFEWKYSPVWWRLWQEGDAELENGKVFAVKTPPKKLRNTVSGYTPPRGACEVSF
jgi:hypothetical protein